MIKKKSVKWMCIGLLTLCGSSAMAATSLSVVDDVNQGVLCNVYIVEGDGPQKLLGQTDVAGDLQLAEPWGGGAKLIIEPVGSNYLAAAKPCDDLVPDAPNKLIVTKIAFLENLQANAIALEQSGKFTDAALVYNEVYNRSKYARPQEASEARAKVSSTFASAMNYLGPILEFDDAQKAMVLTADFESAVASYQRTHGIDDTGMLNFTTLKINTERRVLDYLTKRWTVEPLDGMSP